MGLFDIEMLDLSPRFFLLHSETKDPDSELKSTMFDTRLKFYTTCQENNYQFDSFRRAKYSSNMILKHLKNINETIKVQIDNKNNKEEKQENQLPNKNKKVICKECSESFKNKKSSTLKSSPKRNNIKL